MLTREVGYLSDYYGEPLIPKEKVVTASVLDGTYTATVTDGYVVDQLQWAVNGVPAAGATSLVWTPSPALLPNDKVNFSYVVVAYGSNTLSVPVVNGLDGIQFSDNGSLYFNDSNTITFTGA